MSAPDLPALDLPAPGLRAPARSVPVPPPPAGPTPPFPAGRFLAEAEAHTLYQRVRGFGRPGGELHLHIGSAWAGNLRWARNMILSSGDVRRNRVEVSRIFNGAIGSASLNTLDDPQLRRAVQRAERTAEMQHEQPSMQLGPQYVPPWPRPKIWFDTTYHQTAEERAAIMERVVRPARAAGMLSAGYIQVEALGVVIADPWRLWYYPYTWAQYTVTVRAPDGSGSGWAGMDHTDWSQIDPDQLSQVALEKCLRSQNPVRLEPGRYTTILEPQAVGALVGGLFSSHAMDRAGIENGKPEFAQTDPRYKKHSTGVYSDGPGYSKLGQQVFDARLTVHTDNMDPEMGFPPFYWKEMHVYTPATWITDGVLTALVGGVYPQPAEGRAISRSQFDTDIGAFRMSGKGADTGVSVEAMIATTKRGLLVTRFGTMRSVNQRGDFSGLMTGYTCDGLWLVENGKLSKAVKNFRFTESPVFVLNNIEQIGVPRRIFMPGHPILVPALKVRDFSFTALTDAI